MQLERRKSNSFLFFYSSECERGSVPRSQTHCANDQDFGVTENMAEHNTK